MMTVVFATRNRAASLSGFLEAHARLAFPPGGHRLVVVDNGSTDSTCEVLRRYADRLPLTILHEPRPGKNVALNTALPALQGGDLAVFTDDDVLPRPDWLVRLRAATDRLPDYAIFGGTIVPEWPYPPPAWFAEPGIPLDVLFTQTNCRHGPCPAERIFGPNMALRTALLRTGIRFREDVGPDGSPDYPMGSETELLVRVENAGHRAYFVEDAVVYHVVRPEQITEAQMLARAYRHGLGTGLLRPPDWAHGHFNVAGRPAMLSARALVRGGLDAVAQVLPPSGRRLRWRFHSAWLRGLLQSLDREPSRRSRAGSGPPQGRQPEDPDRRGLPLVR